MKPQFKVVAYKNIRDPALFETLFKLHASEFKGDNFGLPRRNLSKSSWIIAESHEGEPLGFALLQRKPDHLLLHSLVVSPEHRRKGIARALISYVEGQSAPGLPVRRPVSSSNTPMLNLKKQRGWKRIRTEFAGVTEKERGVRREDELLFQFPG
ncbi:MAG: GNAT family N-acetyltransferase [Candidatus Micrarchaeia archaeon]